MKDNDSRIANSYLGNKECVVSKQKKKLRKMYITHTTSNKTMQQKNTTSQPSKQYSTCSCYVVVAYVYCINQLLLLLSSAWWCAPMAAAHDGHHRQHIFNISNITLLVLFLSHSFCMRYHHCLLVLEGGARRRGKDASATSASARKRASRHSPLVRTSVGQKKVTIVTLKLQLYRPCNFKLQL